MERSTRTEVRDYYRTVSRFIELELAGRGDAGYWRMRMEALTAPDVLELGAGTGRVTRMLAPLARSVVAVDLSEDMLALAREAMAGAAGIHLVLADIRALSFGKRFPMVVAANDPFVHLPTDEDRDRALACVARHLSRDGIFVLDAHWLPEAERRAASTPKGFRRKRDLASDAGDGPARVLETWRLDPSGHQGQVTFEYQQGGQIVGRARFHPRLWSREELETRLGKAGLRIRRCLGDYRGTSWDPAHSRRLLLEASPT